MPIDYDTLEDVARESYGSVVWSHKIQEKQSDIYAKRFAWMETVNIVAATLTLAGIITAIFTDPLWVKIVSAIVSFITVGITAYFRTFELQKLMSAHKATANRLLAVRDQYKILLTQIKLKQESFEYLFSRYGELVENTDRIYLEAPSTTDRAVKQAGKALKITKDNTFSDEEIDSFLPESLRRNKNV